MHLTRGEAFLQPYETAGMGAAVRRYRSMRWWYEPCFPILQNGNGGSAGCSSESDAKDVIGRGCCWTVDVNQVHMYAVFFSSKFGV